MTRGRATASGGEEAVRGAWPMVMVLTFCYLVSSLDRYVINLLIQPIAVSLNLTDVQISLLIGLAFTLFYSTAGLLLGSLVDRFNRQRIIIAGILIWTAATAATALAQNHAILLLARVVVGVGEAALAPAAYSLIADTFPRQKLSRPTTTYFLGGAIGPGVAFFLGALALRWAESLNDQRLLGFLQDQPWRFVMLIAAVPGLFAAAAVARYVREPRSNAAAAAAPQAAGSLWGELRSKPVVYLGLLGGTTGVAIYINAIAAWWPTHALRSFGWPLKDGGMYFGMALAFGAVVGILSSGSLATRLIRRHGDAGNGMALRGLAIIAAPVMVVVPFVPYPAAQLAALTASLTLAFAINGLAPVGCQLAAGPAVRGRVSAFYVASTTIIGAGFGPVAVAGLAKIEIGRVAIGLPGGLAIISLFCSIVMVVAYTVYLRSFRISLDVEPLHHTLGQ